MTPNRTSAGIAAMILSSVAFVAGDTSMKLVMTEGVPPLQVLAIRGAVACVLCAGAVAAFGQAAFLRDALNRWVLLRALCETLAVFCFVRALSQMPQGDITAIFQISPLLVILGAAVLFGERIGRARAGLLALGFVGAVMVAQPGAASGYAAAPLGVLGAVLVATRDLAARKTPARVPTMVAALATLATTMVFAAVASALAETPVLPGASGVLLLSVAGLTVTLGNILVIFALRAGEIGAVAPFYYVFTLAAAAAGYLSFGDVPNALAAAGMVLIVGSGVAVVVLERQGRRAPNAPEADVVRPL